jgi:hypothetical protein
MLPGIRLGAPPAFLAADGSDGVRLLAVATDGSLRLWDLRRMALVLEASVEPLLAGLAPGTTGMPPPLGWCPLIGVEVQAAIVVADGPPALQARQPVSPARTIDEARASG